MRLAYEAQPRPRAIASLSGETIVKAACGVNHTGMQTVNLPTAMYCYLVLSIPYDVLVCKSYFFYLISVAVTKDGHVYT